uniref:Spermidine/spermine N1-acetyltransferase family member 2b n=1 Tax=Lates calcarifer TaxID=8187 RepID=A0A4W6BUH7_LATCA
MNTNIISNRKMRISYLSCFTLELERDGFCQNPFFECLVAEVPEEHISKEGFTVVGYALYFYTYSTWRGRSVYLEDLYVMPEFRGKICDAVLLLTENEVKLCHYSLKI